MTPQSEKNTSFATLINNSLFYYNDLWRYSDCHALELGKIHSRAQKKHREKELNEMISKLKKEKSYEKNNFMPETKEVFSFFKRFFFTLLDLNKEENFSLFSVEVEQVTEDFVKQARAFDPTLKKEEIFQACRNVWIMTGLQEIFGIPIALTPSVLAYSLLYPLSDNYLDDENMPAEEKKKLNNRLSARLNGLKIKPLNQYEEKIFALIAKIESEFPRSDFSRVHQSLLSIHNAQMKSLKLINSHNSLSEQKIRDIVFEKGGTSVVADGFLVAGNLERTEINSLFGYGVYLQLLDDLQDIEEDLSNRTKTIFSSSANNICLDSLTNKTFWFGQKVMDEMSQINRKNDDSFTSVMRKSLNMLLIESICLSDKYFTKNYLENIEEHSPISFKEMKKLRSDTSPEKFSAASFVN